MRSRELKDRTVFLTLSLLSFDKPHMFSTKSVASVSLLASFFAQGALAAASKTKRATYPNPIALSGNTSAVRDPSLCKDPSTNTYYVFSTGVGIEIRSSQDLIAWEYVGEVWPDGAPWGDEYNNASNTFWAPDCTIEDGNWRVSLRALRALFCLGLRTERLFSSQLYYSASTIGSQNVRVSLYLGIPLFLLTPILVGPGADSQASSTQRHRQVSRVPGPIRD